MATQCFTCMHVRPLSCTGRTANPLRSAAAAVSQRSAARRSRVSRLPTRAGLDLDWSDPDTLIGLAGAVLGIAVGIGAPLFYISRDEADEKRLEELRELNRQTYKETGEYMTEVGPYPPHVLSLQAYFRRHLSLRMQGAANEPSDSVSLSVLTPRPHVCAAGGDRSVPPTPLDRPQVRVLESTCFQSVSWVLSVRMLMLIICPGLAGSSWTMIDTIGSS